MKKQHVKKVFDFFDTLIKDNAWDYEKEVRLKAEFENIAGFNRVAVRIPNDVLDKITITAGPLFVGDLSQRIGNELQRSFNSHQQIFFPAIPLPSRKKISEIFKNPLTGNRSVAIIIVTERLQRFEE